MSTHDDGCKKCGGQPDKGRWVHGDGFICSVCGEYMYKIPAPESAHTSVTLVEPSGLLPPWREVKSAAGESEKP